MQGRLSLQERLVVLVVAAMLPLAILIAWFALGETESATHPAQAQLRMSASLLAAQPDFAAESARQLLGAIAAMPQMRAVERESCNQYFEAVAAHYPAYDNIGLLDAQGRMVCHGKASAGEFAAGDQPFFRKALGEARFAVGTPMRAGNPGRFVLPFGNPVVEGGKPVAVVFATLDLQRAANDLGSIELPAGTVMTIADRNGSILMQRPAPSPAPASASAGAPSADGRLTDSKLLESARQMVAGSGEWSDAAGEQRLYAFAPSRPLAGERYLAVVSIAAEGMAPTGLAIWRNDLLVLAASLAVGLAMAWLIGGRVIVKPAKQMLGTIRRLEQGRLDARVPLRAGPHRGEFARIGAAFNLMAESLQVRQHELEAELGRSRGAYAVLELVLNSMEEGIMAANSAGQFLMFNDAAAKLFPLHAPPASPLQWPRAFGLYAADGLTLLQPDELPMARAIRGETGRQHLMLVRNQLAPQGRLVQCSWQPIGGEGGGAGGLVVFNDVTELQRLEAEQAMQFEQLRETQRKLIEAQHIGRVGNWELDLRSGQLWWSDEVYALFGVTRESFEPTLNEFARLVHPDDRGLLKPARDSALRDGKVMNIEYRVVRPDGAIIWMHEIAEARRDEEGDPTWFGGVVQDITARKMGDQALLDSERELQDYTKMLQRAAEAAQAITAHPELDATLQEVADQARRVVGARYAAVSLDPVGPGQPANESASGNDIETPLFDRLEVPLANRGGRPVGVLRVCGKEHGEFTERDRYVALEMAQLASIAIDNARLFSQIRELNANLEARIAERTAELARQEQQYRTLAEQAPEVVWNANAQGKVTFLSQAWYELAGGAPADWLGDGWVDRLHPDDIEEVRQNWTVSRRTLQPYTGTRRVLSRDGSWHTMSYRAAPVLDDEGRVVSWVGVDTDITEFKAIERALRTSNQELEAFSYSVSHDLRAPLGAIGGFGRALAMKLGEHPDERVHHYISRIEAGVEKMEQLIESVLGLAQVVRAPLNRGAVDLGAIARETLEGLQMQHPDRVVAVEVEESMLAQGDARLLRIVMENLLGNAWKFTSKRGVARIEVGRSGGAGEFYVRDNGVGFEMAYAGKLFGTFQRLHAEAEFPGNGIGLATVRRIVARHEGRVWAESTPGEGTAFMFTLWE